METDHPLTRLPPLGILAILACLALPASITRLTTGQGPALQPGLVLEQVARYQEGTLFSSDPEGFLGAVGEIAIGDGRVFVWDRANYNIKVFPHDLSSMESLGRLGAGPGEFSRNVRQLEAYRGGVIALDGGNQRITLYGEDGSFAFSTPCPMPPLVPHAMALDERTGSVFLPYRPGTAGDGLIRTLHLGPTGAEEGELLPGRAVFEAAVGTASGGAPPSLFIIGDDTLLLVRNAVTSPDASGVQAYTYNLLEKRLSRPIDLLSAELKELLGSAFRRESERVEVLARERRARGLGGFRLSGFQPFVAMLMVSDGRPLLIASAAGERHAILVDLQIGTATDLGTVPIPSRSIGCQGDLLYVADDTPEGPTVTGYRVIIR